MRVKVRGNKKKTEKERERERGRERENQSKLVKVLPTTQLIDCLHLSGPALNEFGCIQSLDPRPGGKLAKWSPVSLCLNICLCNNYNQCGYYM